MAAAIEKALREIAEDEMKCGVRSKELRYQQEVKQMKIKGIKFGFDVLGSLCGTVCHLRRHCRHLRGSQVGLLTNYKWRQLCKCVAKNTIGRPPPGVTLLLSEQNDSCHTDERCPYPAGARPVRGCVTCGEAEGVV